MYYYTTAVQLDRASDSIVIPLTDHVKGVLKSIREWHLLPHTSSDWKLPRALGPRENDAEEKMTTSMKAVPSSVLTMTMLMATQHECKSVQPGQQDLLQAGYLGTKASHKFQDCNCHTCAID